jgi:CheY-like chemotaxis protein
MIKIALVDTAQQLSGAAMSACLAPERPTVLVVDPSPDRRRIARLSLSLAGYLVREAVDTTDALVALRAYVPDVIVTGVSMPGPCDGLGLCAIVRARTRLRGCEVIVLTGHTDPDRMRRIGESGASAVVVQPFSPAELVAAVDGVAGPGEAAFRSMRGVHPGVSSPMAARGIPE